METISAFPPRTIYDENGQRSGMIVSIPDYQIFLQLLVKHADWETLPRYLQDAVDNMLADSAENERGEQITLAELLAGA